MATSPTCWYFGHLSINSLVSNVQIACNEDLIAAPYNEKCFGVWNMKKLCDNPILFHKHKNIITALSFGSKSEPIILASGSEDCVVVWFLEKNFNDDGKFCHKIRDITVAKDLGSVQHISFDKSQNLISLCVGNEVWIIKIETCELNAIIKGHHGNVNASKFSPHEDNSIVTISDDRTFKIFDYKAGSVLYHSAIISAYPFLSIDFHLYRNKFSLGSVDGMVRTYSLEGEFKCLRSMDLNKCYAQYLNGNHVEIDSELESSLAVIGLCYNRYFTSTHALYDKNHYAISELDESDVLVCATVSAIFVIDVSTCQPVKMLDYRELIPNVDEPSKLCAISLSGSCVFDQQQEKIICAFGNLFDTSISLLHVNLALKKHSVVEEMRSRNSNFVGDKFDDGSTDNEKFELSVLSRVCLRKNSPLRAELVPKDHDKILPKRVVKNPELNAKKNKGTVVDHPVTFRKIIKSSGYSASPRNKMFSPKLNPTKQPHAGKSLEKTNESKQRALHSENEVLLSNYVIPEELEERINICSSSVVINQIKFNHNGKKLACGLANNTACMIDSTHTSKQKIFTGHNGEVHSVNWSFDGQYLLTSSKDNTACLWSAGTTEPLISFNRQNYASKSTTKDNPIFCKGLNRAAFYYVDKFILISSGNFLHLYKYHLDFNKDDLKRYRSKGHYKLVTSLSLDKALNMTSFTCINGFYSYIVICAGSSRSIQVFDMNVERSLRTLEDVHTRSVHCVQMNEGSKTFSLPSQCYDLFLTGAVADGVKIWDLRNTRCVRKYEGHVSRTHPVGVMWSPCGKYFAVGSEDKSAYIYDIRHNYPFKRISKHSDVVVDVAFHPNKSQLVTATLDGKIYFYIDKT
ncbi:WD repeat-containing protein 27-like [Xenia sp. Carnegie-2017]|uniref:WD repeat-containing protein 27-like n=1 Tax=Xenia sp. Carnegie-2017 TaxID=2897299 RepID=UPI001F048241|nr:WD repeat-containing protein 27-like [Xenia sp. Carnegie-2017]